MVGVPLVATSAIAVAGISAGNAAAVSAQHGRPHSYAVGEASSTEHSVPASPRSDLLQGRRS
jgi:hypothetical protein